MAGEETLATQLTSRSIIFWGSGASTFPAGLGSIPALVSSAERKPATRTKR